MYNYDRYKSSDKCPICGNEVLTSDLFCERCGMRIYTHLPQKNTNVAKQSDRVHSAASRSMDHPSDAKHGLRTLSEMPDVKAVIDNCKASLRVNYPDISVLIDDLRGRILEDINEIIDSDFKDLDVFKTLGPHFIEERDFGLEKCSEAAKKFFPLGVIMGWVTLSAQERMVLSEVYANAVAKAFELVSYNDISYKELEPGVDGYNNGDGRLYLSKELLKPRNSPFEIIDTITHELRHQYQAESRIGHHNISDDVRREWIEADNMYNRGMSCYFNPWGYNYNPLEIDARYAGETVVRNLTHYLFNSVPIKSMDVINRQQLRTRLVQEGYSGALLEQTTDDLIKLDGKAAEMLRSWLNDGIKPEFNDIEGLDSRLLREHYQMKEPAIILSYGMLMNNPVQNSKHLKNALYREQRLYK